MINMKDLHLSGLQVRLLPRMNNFTATSDVLFDQEDFITGVTYTIEAHAFRQRNLFSKLMYAIQSASSLP